MLYFTEKGDIWLYKFNHYLNKSFVLDKSNKLLFDSKIFGPAVLLWQYFSYLPVFFFLECIMCYGHLTFLGITTLSHSKL